LADAARSLLDGHVVLSSALARTGHFPAIDVPASTSRTMAAVTTAEHARDAGAVRAVLALLAESKDARAVGLGTGDPALRSAIAAEGALEAFLRQREFCPPPQTLRSLRSLAGLFEART
jgi:flagellum-specific ATP synthase